MSDFGFVAAFERFPVSFRLRPHSIMCFKSHPDESKSGPATRHVLHTHTQVSPRPPPGNSRAVGPLRPFILSDHTELCTTAGCTVHKIKEMFSIFHYPNCVVWIFFFFFLTQVELVQFQN